MDKIFSKEWWKPLLIEAKLSAKDRKELIKKFLVFAKNELNLIDFPKISFTTDENIPQKHRALGFYNSDSQVISIYVKNRNLADILRTLAHELVHEKQNQEGRIDYASGKTGSKIENEANAQAGILLRQFGKKHPEIYE